MNQTKINIREGYIYQDMDHEAIIFSPEQSQLFTFNETAAFILKLILKGMSIEKISDTVSKTYNIDKKAVENDYKELIENLKKNNIIEWS